MKRKRTWKRYLCALLMGALLAAIPGSALGASEAGTWTYENSILITVLVEKEQNFTPADFPEIDCNALWIVEKTTTGQGILYELILTLKNGDSTEISEAIQAVSQSKIVKSAQRTEKYATPKSTVSLNKSVVYLKAGDTIDLTIQDVNLVENPFQNIGIAFSINPELFEEDTLEKDSFLEYGISRFWPNTEKREEILIEKPGKLEAQKSEDGKYYGWIPDTNTIFNTINTLAQLPEISSVSIVRMAVPGGTPPSEYWSVNKIEILDLSLSGGDIAAGFGEGGPRLNQTATIKGLKQGISTLTVERTAPNAHASAHCTVIVYEPGSKNNPGDINHDGSLTTNDALQVLKHAANITSLDENNCQAADLNQDNKVNTTDALMILKIVAGLL